MVLEVGDQLLKGTVPSYHANSNQEIDPKCYNKVRELACVIDYSLEVDNQLSELLEETIEVMQGAFPHHVHEDYDTVRENCRKTF